MKSKQTLTLAMAALFAALCYVGFSYFRIDIPVGTEKTAFHLGNVFCVLAALFIGGFWGGMSGAVGMTIADLTSGYVTSAPKTFLLKLCIGLVVGLVAHKVFHISRGEDCNERNASIKVPLPVATVLSCIAGMAFNVVADPVVGYFYKTYVLGIPQEAAAIWAKMGAVTTLVNAVVAVIVASIFYLALRPALKHAKLFPTL
ncbi:MAG: ECF transporter S component [Faecousia sp.]